MDFAASEAKKRGQSFRETAVNLRRKHPGTNQPCPIMRPAPAGRSGPGSFQGHRSILQGRKNFSPLRGAIRAQKLWMCPTRSHAAGTEKMPICRAANLRGAVRAQRLWMCPTRSHAAGTEETPICRAASLRGAIRAQRLWICPPGLRRRPAAQNKKGTRIGCLSAWCG